MTAALVIVLVGYLGLLVAVYLMQRRMIYYPDTSAPEPLAGNVSSMQVVTTITDDGLSLRSWYYPPPDDRAPVIVYFQGNAGHYGDRDPVAQAYVAAGFGVLLAGFRGYGGNPGKPTERGLYADGRAAIRFLSERGVESPRIVLYGESLGSAVAVMLAAEREVGAIVLQAPFTSAGDVGQRACWFLLVKLLIRDRFDALSLIGGVHAPLLVLYSRDDPVVPPDLTRRLFEAASGPKEIREYATAGHNGFSAAGAPRDVVTFLKNVLKT